MCWEIDYKFFSEQKKAQETRTKQEQRRVIDQLLNDANKQSEKTNVEGTPVKEVALERFSLHIGHGIPQPPRGLRVLCLRARRPLLLVEEVSPAHIGNIRRGCEPHKGVCPLLWAARHRLENPHP